MKIPVFATIALALVFTAACDPDAPPRHVETATPEWVRSIHVERIAKNAAILHVQGQSVHVSRSGTDLGNGLTATRQPNRLSITDKNGITCHWNRSKDMTGCRKPNPDYQAYQAAKPDRQP